MQRSVGNIQAVTNALLHSGLFGSLMQDDEVAALFSSDAMAARMLDFERAWTVALREAGQCDAEAARIALEAIDGYSFDLTAIASAADRDGVPVPALVSGLRDRAGPQGASAIHAGATSQDVIDTALVLALSDALDLFCNRMDRFDAVLATLADRFGTRPMMGRTRMQAARPITVADRVATWRRPLADLRETAPALRDRLRCVQYGGAVGTRDGVAGQGDAIARILGRELNLAVPTDSWHTDRAAFADFGHWMVKLSGACGKFGQDVALMAQQGVEEVGLSGTGGSSAMAHKRNPIRAEILVSLARYTTAQQSLLSQALVHEQERSGTAWALEWLTLPALTEATGASLNAALALAAQIDWLGLPDAAN